MRSSIRVLYIQEDREATSALLALFKHFQSPEFKATVTHALTLAEALMQIDQSRFDVILTDLFLPDSHGINTFLEVHKKASAAPIIVLGRLEETPLADQLIHLGAQDYLPFTTLTKTLLKRVISFAIERHHLQESLRALSFTDELTGLYNRRGFITLLEQQRALTERSQKGFFLFAADLDFLKQINDTYGHLVGDKALIAVAECLNHSFRHHDIIGRIGGDEFAAIALNARPESGAYLRRHIVEVIDRFNRAKRYPFELSLSVGAVYYDGKEKTTLDDLIYAADLDLYRAKKRSHEKRR